jgi:amino acid adenylation domain-containing protein
MTAGKTVLDRFAEQVATRPSAPAVACGDARLTYAELDARATRVAAALRARGTGPESRVGLCLDRTPDLPVAMLAILKAGAAFVALDPAHPADRLRRLVEDSGASCVIAEPGAAWTGDAERVTVKALARAGGSGPLPHAGPGNAMYVVFTSGSTGRPKAVVMEHGPTARLMSWAARRYDLTGPVPQYFPVTSDVCAYEIFSTWWAGGCVVVVEEDDRYDAARLAGLIHRHGVATALLPGAVLADLAAHTAADPAAVATLRQLATTGDRLTVGDDLRRMCRGRTLDNQWGSTEVNVVTAGLLSGPADDWPATPSIGSPVSGGRIHVLDDHLNRVPVNVPGDLYVGGSQLARGYLGRADLTAAAFLPDPYTPTPGARMYRTGDRGRWRPDGTLEFLGRGDFQVKVHGYRVEPGEIEGVLRAHPSVARAAVVAERTGGDVRLVAYATPRESEVDTAVLREHLRDRLPQHMVPAVVVALEEMPLTATGKVDRARLPAAGAEPAPVRTEPRDDVERRIIEVWKTVLKRETIGPEDDFFSLGGHSLLCVQVVARIGRAFDVELPLRAMFTHRTPAEFAEVVAGARAGGQPKLARQPAGSPRVLSFAQQRLWFLDQLQPGMTAYNLPRAHRLRGPLDAGALRRAFDTIVARHPVLRSHFEEVDGEPSVVVADPVTGTVDSIDLSGEPEPERAALELLRGRAETPFDLSGGPLVRAALVRLAPEDHILQTVIHHAVYDGLSQQILSEELSRAYRAELAGEPAGLPEPAVEYTDYAAWQRALLAGDASADQAAYWRTKLGGAPAVLELPADRPRPPVPTYLGAAVPFAVPADVVARLREIANDRQATTFMLTLAAFQVLLARYARTDDLIVGCPVSGRSEPELEDLVGFFVNSIALRARVSGAEPFTALLDQVRETTLDAFAHQDLPFEQLVQVLAPPRDLSRNPVIQVWFQLFEAESLDRFDLSGLSVSEFLDLDTATTTRFDLELQLQVAPGGGLNGQVVYATGLFDESTVRRFAEHYTTLLAAIAADPEARVDRLAITTAEEREHVLGEWSDRAGGALVLDERLEPAPVNVPGDLHTPAETDAEPVQVRGRPYYPAGELARWRADGSLERLGRPGRLLRVRGYRLDLAEVEAALREHPAIAAAAVTAHDTEVGVRLAAYLVPAAGETVPEPAPLRDWLRQGLLDQFVPQAFTVLGELPVTAAGAVDVAALPEPDLDVAHVAPRDDTDREILALWCELLGHTDIGIHDNFFDVGGHSLLIPQVVHRVNKAFGTELPMRALFDAQTVMTLADRVRAAVPGRHLDHA